MLTFVMFPLIKLVKAVQNARIVLLGMRAHDEHPFNLLPLKLIPLDSLTWRAKAA